jgi:UTP--glucose-1-phosphate uridylyltransferase
VTAPRPGPPAVRKAVIPAAGMGTRFLPATKSMPKEMLPIIDKPVVQYVVEEAAAVGIEDVLIITGRGKRAIENHFDYAPGLEAFLQEAGKPDLARLVREIGEGCDVFFIRQKRQLGLGDAIRLARRHTGAEPFAVLLGDSIIDSPPEGPPGLRQLLDAHAFTGSSVVAVQRVPREHVGRYGVIDGEPVPGRPDLLRVRRLVEKPSPERAPSDLAIAGRYVFTPEIHEAIDRVGRGVGGEIQLTDAMNLLAGERPLHALVWKARRYDIGDRIEYAKCFIDFALRRDDTARAIEEHLRGRLRPPRGI